MPSLTIDLAARAQNGKVDELDTAIFRQIHEWGEETNRKEKHLHGVRIYDSLNRKGNIPDLESIGGKPKYPLSGRDIETNHLNLNPISSSCKTQTYFIGAIQKRRTNSGS